jgi:hypothetical protein
MSTANGSTTTPLVTATFDLDPDELFTSISGSTLINDRTRSILGVASLSFSTNKRVYGPFGFATTANLFEVRGPVYALHGAVTRSDTSDILAAIGFWKVPAGMETA